MSAIEVSHLTKEYRLGALQGLKETLLNVGARLRGKQSPQRPLFKALDDVSFSIEPGEVVGVIGHNGAGKSTLLKMLARISNPSLGSVTANGRIAPLIEVGAGFVPDFTGRENVYLNGSILGMSKKEIDKKFEEIVDFAEMAEFIDTPVKRYSSGMQVKLAFAVATSIEAEILIVDEVLAVGDLAFQRKCFDRMETLIKQQQRTVILVSHNLRHVERICHRVILLDHGRIIEDGNSQEVCNVAYRLNDEKILQDKKKREDFQARAQTSGEVELLDARMETVTGGPLERVLHGSDVVLRFTYRILRPLSRPVFLIGIHTTDFIYLGAARSIADISLDHLDEGLHQVVCHIRRLPLLPGVYAFRTAVFTGEMFSTTFSTENLLPFQVEFQHAGEIENNLEGIIPLYTTWALQRTPSSISPRTSAAKIIFSPL